MTVNPRTYQLRKLARRVSTERNRLNELADDFRVAKLPMCAKDVGRYAACLAALEIALDTLADDTRDPRGAKRSAAAVGEQR